MEGHISHLFNHHIEKLTQSAHYLRRSFSPRKAACSVWKRKPHAPSAHHKRDHSNCASAGNSCKSWKHFNIPPSPIETDDFFFAKVHIGADEGNPVFTVMSVTHTNNFGRRCFFADVFLLHVDFHGDGQQVFGTAAALLAGCKICLTVMRFPSNS